MSKKLDELRKEVDKLDEELINLLKKRFKIAVQIWKIKKPLGMKIKNSKREQEIINEVTKKSGFRKKFVKKFYKLLFSEGRRIQKESVK